MIALFGVTIDPVWAALVVGASLLGGFMRGFVGFGGALALVPVLSLAMGPKPAVAVASLVGLPSVLQLLPEAIRDSDRKLVGPAAIAIMTGAPLGSLILTTVEPRIMTAAIGVAVILMALANWYGVSPRVAGRVWAPAVAGLISGMLQGSAGMGGPPSVAVVLARGGEPRQQRANVLGVVAVIAVSGAVSHLSFGLFTRQALMLAIVLLPLFLGSTWLGSRFFALGGQRHFRSTAILLLLGIGLAAVVGSFRGG